MTRVKRDRSAAVEMLETLYPSAHSTRSGRDSVHRHSFVAVPSVAKARLLLSAESPRATAHAVRRQLSGQRRRTRLARSVIAAAASTGGLRWLPRAKLTVTPDDATDFTRELAHCLGRQYVHLALPVGPARANRKPIVQVSDESGAPLAFVKVGHNPLTRSLVSDESQTLARLGEGHPLGLHIPERLFEFDWHGSRVLGMTPLIVPAHRLSGRGARARLVRLARSIATLPGQTSVRDWTNHPLRHRLGRSFATMGERGSPFAEVLEALDGHTQLETGAWHGDFNSGNFALVEGDCPVWDWERFERDVPVGFDVLHHDLHHWITVDGAAPREAAERLVVRAPSVLEHVVPRERCEHVVRAYLLTLAERYLRDDQETAGATLGAVGSWLLPVLARGPEVRAR
ncbi:hypothetical protein [Solicola gregarius]|uniref:Uncharacterized protein n=1 Tax=Solicola gregarius TaxID=2908642 RepID=A0AA46YL55_9ACTN|nr:hypothetical protein [Solicola gregarius]UYM06555.1 hypothetical protein L0C25_05635 [Solicola gregarius]